MKAVVMAGGFGTRLRPLTEKLPKPMAHVANRPMMEHVVRLLAAEGIDDLEVLLHFYPEKISSYFGDGTPWGVRMNYVNAEADYGTAGAVKNAEERLSGTFMVISADIITDFDLSKAIDFHKERGAAVTIVLTRVPNPLQYGIVITEEDGRIVRFLEKPTWGEVFSDTINTGIYIVEPDVLGLIPPKKNWDFSKNLFPAMLARGDRLLGYVAEGYWKDVGNLDEYLNVHLDLLAGKVKIGFEGEKAGERSVWIGEGSKVDYTAELSNVLLGRKCVVGSGVTMSNVVVGDGCVVEDGAVLQSSVLWERVSVGKGARIFENIVGSDVAGGARRLPRGAGGDQRPLRHRDRGRGQAEREGVAPQGGRGRGGPVVLPHLGGEVGALPLRRLRDRRAGEHRDLPRVRGEGRGRLRRHVRKEGGPLHQPGQPQGVADDQPRRS